MIRTCAPEGNASSTYSRARELLDMFPTIYTRVVLTIALTLEDVLAQVR
jgi:hypothetical protein